jgi:peroxiredoxin
MKRFPAVLIALVCFACASRMHGADAKNELQALVGKVKAKLQAGNPTEQDLAPELKDFDTLLAEHKGEKTNDVADILLLKGMLYAQVFSDYPKATEALQELKANFPGSPDANKVDPILAAFAKQEEAKKVQDSLAVGTPFPDFDVQDLDGKPLSVASEKGKIVLIDFWATWCGPCVAELPNVMKVYAKDHDKGFNIIGVSLDEDKSKLTSFVKEKNMTWPQYFDGQGGENTLASKYGIATIPATFLVGKDGKIIGKNLRGDDLDSAVTAALAAN